MLEGCEIKDKGWFVQGRDATITLTLLTKLAN